MIYVSQGHEDGIGLEVFLKTLIFIDQKKISKLTLVANPQDLLKAFEELQIKYELKNDQITFCGSSLSFVESKNLPTPSSSSLEIAMKLCEEKDILFTLPTTKDQLIKDNTYLKGHTEYFRHYFSNQNIGMCFYRKGFFTLLLTDHIQLKDVPKTLTSDFIFTKTSLAIDEILKIHPSLGKIIFSGLNPHAGENGLLGTEEEQWKIALEKLKKKYSQLQFSGPIPGDTIHFHHEENTLLIYAFHDQGLASFKTKHGLFGANISLGLPFLRVSPDFGVAFDKRNTNQAYYSGMIELIHETLKFEERVKNGN